MVSKDKSSVKRKRVESQAVAVQEPVPAPAPPAPSSSASGKSDKKKKVEAAPSAPVVEPVTTSTPKTASTSKTSSTDKKSEKRKREESPAAPAPSAASSKAKETSDKAKNVENGHSNGEIKKQKTIEPPHNLHLARKLNVVKCRVDLYKIPPQCINFEPTKTHLYVDTLKFTKKYLLKIPYPEGVQVDTEVEAKFDSGVLTCDFPILSDPNRPKDHDAVVGAREQIKEMKQKGIPIPTDLLAAAKLAKTKADKNPVAEAEGDAEEAEKPKQNKPTVKKTLSNKERRQKEKAKRPLNEDGTEAPRPKKKAKGEKKKKEFLANPEDALQMADQVNDQQEKDIQAKYDKEYSKLSYETRKKIENKEKKIKLRELRKQELDKAIEKMPKKESKKSSTKVSFAEQD